MAKASEWRERIAEWRASGLSAVKFAEMRGYSAQQVWKWAAKIRKTDAAGAAEAAGPTRASSDAPYSIPLARVVRAPKPEFGERPPAPAGAMAVEVGGMRLVVPAGFDRRTLAMVLDEALARKSMMGVH
jgi:transposase